jgi:hypothetical protein
MYPITAPAPIAGSKRTGLVAGRIVSGLVATFLIFDAGAKLALVRQVVEANAQLGFPVEQLPLVGTLLLLSTVLYLVPRTAVLGAVLLTGYLGGAIAVQLRVGNPAFETLFPAMVAALAWAGLLLRDARRMRALQNSD